MAILSLIEKKIYLNKTSLRDFLYTEERIMFDIVKDYGAELVIIDQILTTRGTEFYTKISVDTEVAKNQKDPDFKHYIFNVVNPKIKGYLTNNALPIDIKYESVNFIMMSCILEYFKHLRVELDDEDVSIISNNVDLENGPETLKEHFSKKYGEDKADEYVEVARECASPMKFALSVYSNYKAAKGNIAINSSHLNTFKMLMGKEFMETAYTEKSEEPTSNSEEKKAEESQANASATSKISGCYIATCVYQSYDCPEVWCLRRYRDNYLAKHLFGRAFIKVYYATSPTLVKWFGKTRWFNKVFRPYLDKKVQRLIDKGYSTLPYND